jgi:hypothetical protein
MPPRDNPLALPADDVRLAVEKAARSRLALNRGKPAFRPAPPIVDAIRAVIPTNVKGDGPTVKALQLRWPEIVGPLLAAHTRPEKRSRGPDGDTLVLRVSPSAGPMVQMQTVALLERINLFSGGRQFSRIALDSAPLPRNVQRKAPIRRALDAFEEAELEAQVEPITDEKLRRALLGLGRAMAARIYD